MDDSEMCAWSHVDVEEAQAGVAGSLAIFATISRGHPTSPGRRLPLPICRRPDAGKAGVTTGLTDAALSIAALKSVATGCSISPLPRALNPCRGVAVGAANMWSVANALAWKTARLLRGSSSHTRTGEVALRKWKKRSS